MNEMKYVILEIGGLHLPFIFPATYDHSFMANTIGGTVVSAGRCHVDRGVTCYNGSVTLNQTFDLTRSSQDECILAKHLINPEE